MPRCAQASNFDAFCLVSTRLLDSAPLAPTLRHPISFSVTADHLAWLDQRRADGSLSRSAALRQALDKLIRLEAAAQAQESNQPSHG